MDNQIVDPALIDVKRLANLLGVSTRHVWRMQDGGAMPKPVRLGGSVRWRLDGNNGIRKWIADGCPSCRNARGAA